MEQKVLRAVMVCLLLMSMAILGRETATYVETVNVVNALQGNNADTDGIPTVVIDAGHGGDDPGKIGINGAPEKDINLRITEKLRQYLEADGIRVVLTRETEDGLYDASAPNKKVQDMKRRIEKIEQTDPVLTVSIHQNSYHQEPVCGGQVFYYKIKRPAVEAGRKVYGCFLEFDLSNPLHQFDKGLVEQNQIPLNVRWELKTDEWGCWSGYKYGSYSDEKYMFIMDVCECVYEELKEEDYDKVKQAYKEYREAGNPPILGEDGDEIVYE